ncbi:hypothetical protein LYNGBM3L_64950 [Moorena producens 3L]|uniref:Uncharacterized protein n=1 Tax=Moorena producens 3L TaxID=489825 RepID=F4Y1X0_9CYAN|nr:hypothetical protein LYNGBM3L_64950 [Moorena producens 3L]OLT64197.1 hypothetical protein BI334_03400 [Moorena producens 3L]
MLTAECLHLELGIFTNPIVYKSGQAVDNFLLTEEFCCCFDIRHSKAFLAPKATSILTVCSQSLINLSSELNQRSRISK